MGKAVKMTAGGAICMVLILLMSGCELNNKGGGDQVLTHKDSLCLGLLSRINVDSVNARINKLTDLDTRFALAPNRRQVAYTIRNMFRRAGYDNASVDSFEASVTWNGTDYTTWQYNVSAELAGNVHPDSVNILGAHYDDIVTNADPFTVAPGANDNASGVAGMIEVARVMKAANYKPAISIKFVAFSAEEIGLLGSSDFVDKLVESGRPVGIMINQDMIAKVNTSNYQLWAVKVLFYGNSKPLAQGSANVCARYIGLYPKGDTANVNKYDSYSFFRKNIKALTFTSADSDFNYHLTSDVSLETSPTYCSLVTGLSAVMLVYYD